MRRVVSLSKYVPYDVIGKSREFQTLFDLGDDSLTTAWEDINWVREGSFIFTTDPKSVYTWEIFLDLPHEGTLEERQKRVFAEWNRRTIWTDRTFRKWLDGTIGENRYALTYQYNDYTFNLDVFVKGDFNLPRLIDMIREIVPANLGFNFKISVFRAIEITTKSANLPYPQFLCGEHACGTIPDDRHMGRAFKTSIGFTTAINNGKEYYGYTNDGYKAGELRGDGSEEILYIQDFSRENAYEFKEEDE